MRLSAIVALCVTALCAESLPCPANVVISNSATQNMTCSVGVCSPTAAKAVLNVQDLEAMLASGSATVKTTGNGVQAVNIRVDARLTWSAGTTLTLDAYRSIDVSRDVAVAGTGGVSLITDDGGSDGDFACDGAGRIHFADLSSALTINGKPYMLVNSVASLASAIAAKPWGAFALAKNYDAKRDGSYLAAPVATYFQGSFNGLGNTISNLSIKGATDMSNVGLFAETVAEIANVRLIDEYVQTGSYAFVGGLVGRVYGGSIAHAFNSGTVIAPNGTAGGLIGDGDYLMLMDSGSVATVSGVWAGGLMGFTVMNQSGLIRDSWATGSVSSSGPYGEVGGLVGEGHGANIKYSWASGQVTGTSGTGTAGGLVGGLDFGFVERSHATGTVTCGCTRGGLVGASSGLRLSESHATGAVTDGGTDRAGTAAGGLLGACDACTESEIVNTYASGAVSGAAWQTVGGLVGDFNGEAGYHPHAIATSYASGPVNGTHPVGGLIGKDNDSPHGNFRHTYWDTTTSGITDPGQGAGTPLNDPGIKGLSDAQLKSVLPKGFSPKIWNEDPNINGGLPYLIHNPPPK